METNSRKTTRLNELGDVRSREVKAKYTSLVYEGEKDLTIYTLEMLKGHAFVSKQFISDLINSPNLKKAEKDLITQHLSQYPEGSIRVQTFAEKVVEDLLPLKRNGKVTTRHDNTVLKGELRGQVHNYGEQIYSGQYKTEAGNSHFRSLSGEKKNNYFAHTRTEDLVNTTTRRIIEIQSDLFQGYGIEREYESVKQNLAVDVGWKISLAGKKYEVLELFKNGSHATIAFAKVKHGKKESYINLFDKEVLEVLAEKRCNEIKHLQTNRNTWHERIIQGEIRQAAKDKMTALLFPTGDTAMKIEDIRQSDKFYNLSNGSLLEANQLEIGMEILQQNQDDFDRLIICKVLKDGKFMATSKDKVESQLDKALTKGETISFLEALSRAESKSYVGTYDVNTSDEKNPIYRFYEKDIPKFLTKFGVKKITDERGVSWFEIPITPEMSKMPVMAFGGSGLEMILSEKQKQSNEKDKGIDRQNELNEIRGKSEDNIITLSK